MADDLRWCRDDRGRLVPVPSPLANWERERLELSARGARLLAARETLYAVTSNTHIRVVAAVAAAVLAWLAISWLEWFTTFTDAPIGRFLIRAPVSLFMGFAVYNVIPRRVPALATAASDLSEARMCVSCGADLATEKPGTDGCTACGKCGCAVRLSGTR